MCKVQIWSLLFFWSQEAINSSGLFVGFFISNDPSIVRFWWLLSFSCLPRWIFIFQRFVFKLFLGFLLQPYLRFSTLKKLVSWISFPWILTYAPGWWHQSLLADSKSSTTWTRIRIIWIFYLLPVAVVDKITALTISLIPLSWRYLFLSSSNEICGEHFFDLQSCLSSRSCLWDSSGVCWSSRPTPALY